MLFSHRKRMAELAARESAGESLWTKQFDPKTRGRLAHAAMDAGGSFGADMFFERARRMILRTEGLFFLTEAGRGAREDFFACLLQGRDEMIPDLIEALSLAFTHNDINAQVGNWHGGKLFDASVNKVLREERISFELIEHQMIGFESREMHVEVVAPALTLLCGRQGWELAEKAYQDALREISQGAAADAITDAGTALQEALTAAGCEGNQLGDLIKSARRKGLIAPHDSALTGSIEKAFDWASADRSQTGDAHHTTAATVDDAWLTVHVVGALILRLAGGGSRTAPGWPRS